MIDPKLEAVIARVEAGESVAQLARELGLSRQTLHARLKRYARETGRRPRPDPPAGCLFRREAADYMGYAHSSSIEALLAAGALTRAGYMGARPYFAIAELDRLVAIGYGAASRQARQSVSCKGCGELFTRTFPLQDYCSPACGDRARHRGWYWRMKARQEAKQ